MLRFLNSASHQPAYAAVKALAILLVNVSVALVITIIITSGLLLANTERRQIAYYSYLDGDGAIRLMDIERGLTHSIFRTPNWVNNLSWSPDGEQLAFVFYENGYFILNLMKADGSSAHRLTVQTASNQRPIWSPDGKQIAFESSGYAPPYATTFVIDPSGENLHNITDDQPNGDLSWSQDGKQVALSSLEGNNSTFEIYIMDDACIEAYIGCQSHQITSNDVNDTGPAWSPDGKRIAFVVEYPLDPNRRMGAYIVDSDCYNEQAAHCANRIRQLTNMNLASNVLRWSPDGRWLTFESYPDGIGKVLYLLDMMCEDDPCENRPLPITDKNANADSLAWSPDSRYVTYISRENGNYVAILDVETCIQNPDTCDQQAVRLTSNKVFSWYPAWRP